MTRPAEEPGTPLEPTGNDRPREMVTLDRIRLTGLLPKAPAPAGAFYLRISGYWRNAGKGEVRDGLGAQHVVDREPSFECLDKALLPSRGECG